VLDLQIAATGEIRGVLTAEHGLIEGDLFLDCTGFRRSLMSKVDPGNQFESNAASLFCDRAVVLRFPYESEESTQKEMDPFVTASAQSAGWIWKIPLWSRISSGYVYSSAFLTEDQAENELRRYWGYDRTKDCVPHKVKFQTGKLRQLWTKNCVAIGLAGGFVEPLESTGLAITQIGLEMLAAILDARYYDEPLRARYNMHLQKFCSDIIHFITAHYCFTQREDTDFWRAVKRETYIPDELAARLEVFRTLLPTNMTRALDEVWAFREFSWFAVLLGLNFPFEKPNVKPSLFARTSLIRKQRALYIEKLSGDARSHADVLRADVYERYQIPLDHGIQLPRVMPEVR
jgi:tryptophan halogenase